MQVFGKPTYRYAGKDATIFFSEYRISSHCINIILIKNHFITSTHSLRQTPEYTSPILLTPY
jgi:hypothetical protein